MAKIYARLIKNGTINPKTGKPYALEDVPESLRDAVRALLEEKPVTDSGRLVKDITKVK